MSPDQGDGQMGEMGWVLIFILASVTETDKVVSPITVPMATEKLCEEAKTKLTEAYKRTESPNFLIVGECLKVR
jgi:hypothetical protein